MPPVSPDALAPPLSNSLLLKFPEQILSLAGPESLKSGFRTLFYVSTVDYFKYYLSSDIDALRTPLPGVS